MTKKLDSFQAFWPYYLGEHAKASTRRWHFCGTSFVIGCLLLALAVETKLLVLLPFLGYGPAWFSHLYIEKNKPATFTYPVWSLIADFKMWWLTLRGKIDEEVTKYVERGS